MDIIAKLEALKEKMSYEAEKWVRYLGTCEGDAERVKELQRKLLETWLEGATTQWEK
jgi:hypothetical protein